MKKGRVAASATVLVLALTGCGGGASGLVGGEDTYNWDFTVTVSDTSSWYLGAEKFAEILEEESDGRITVNVFANEQLSGGDPTAGVEQLMKGHKAFSYSSTIIYSGIDPRFSAINAPFLYRDYEEADAAVQNGALAAYEDLAHENGVELLGFGESGFRQITTNSTSITEPSDLDHQKIRVPGSSLFVEIYEGFGADPISMNFSEVFTSLQNGTLDGQENPLDVIYSNGLSDVQGHLTMWNYVYDPLVLGMNKELFDSLSAEDRALVERAAAEANELQIADNRAREVEQLAELKSTIAVTELDASQLDAFREAVDPIYNRFESIWTPELVDAVQPE